MTFSILCRPFWIDHNSSPWFFTRHLSTSIRLVVRSPLPLIIWSQWNAPCGLSRVYRSSDSHPTFAITMTFSDKNRNALMASEVSRCIVPNFQHGISLSELMTTHHYSLGRFPIKYQNSFLAQYCSSFRSTANKSSWISIVTLSILRMSLTKRVGSPTEGCSPPPEEKCKRSTSSA